MHKVLVVGDANVDIIVPYPRFLNKTKTLVAYPRRSLYPLCLSRMLYVPDAATQVSAVTRRIMRVALRLPTLIPR